MPSGMKSTLAALACTNPYRHAQNASNVVTSRGSMLEVQSNLPHIW